MDIPARSFTRRFKALGTLLFGCLMLATSTLDAAPMLISHEEDGSFRRWHKITLQLDGPQADERGDPNPFTDYRFDVSFTHSSGETFRVPGHFAADGDAANSSATSGDKWHAHFSPNKTGAWSYQVHFYSGSDVAIADRADLANFKTVDTLDGLSGSFEVVETNKSGRDFRAKGRLNYVGKHHLQFEGTGEFFFKAGTDSPENLLSYDDIDDTPNDPFDGQDGPANEYEQSSFFHLSRKDWKPHQQDYLTAVAEDKSVSIADYTWKDGHGSELLGALYYLSEIEGINGISMLLFTLDGDDDNVFPHVLRNGVEAFEALDDSTGGGFEHSDRGRWADPHGGVFHDRFDVSKMSQWERIHNYAQAKGLYMDLKLQETENDVKMDAGLLGRERKLYYRELISRLGHNLAFNWNLGEESDPNRGGHELNDKDLSEMRKYTRFFYENDPYNHMMVVHTYPNMSDQQSIYGPLLGDIREVETLIRIGNPEYNEDTNPDVPKSLWVGADHPRGGDNELGSHLGGVSLQTNEDSFRSSYLYAKFWVDNSKHFGRPWVVMNDEPGQYQWAVVPDAAVEDIKVVRKALGNNKRNQKSAFDSHINARRNSLWGALMAGGSGANFYFGYQFAHGDISADDFRSRDRFWDYCRILLEFLESEEIPFWEMTNPVQMPTITRLEEEPVQLHFGGANRQRGEIQALNSNIRVLKKEGEIYIVQVVNASIKEEPAILDLSGDTAKHTYTVTWVNPRTGEQKQSDVKTVTGGTTVELGNPPEPLNTQRPEDNDWIILIRRD